MRQCGERSGVEAGEPVELVAYEFTPEGAPVSGPRGPGGRWPFCP